MGIQRKSAVWIMKCRLYVLYFALIIIGLWVYESDNVYALEELPIDYTDVNEHMPDSSNDTDFEGMVHQFATGSINGNLTQSMINTWKDQLFAEIRQNAKQMKWILLIGIFSAILSKMALALRTSVVSDTGQLVSVMLVGTSLYGIFEICMQIASSFLEQILSFMKCLLPVYMCSLGLFLGGSGVRLYYESVFVFLCVMDILILKIAFPVIRIYGVFTLMNGFTKDKIAEGFLNYMEYILNFIFKGFCAATVFLSALQGMLLPGIAGNRLTNSVIRSLSGTVGVSVSNLVYGSAGAIKSGIGAAGCVVLLIYLAVPFIKLFVTQTCLQGVSMILTPVADQRMIDSTVGMKKAVEYLLKGIFLSAVMCMVMIAVICMTAQRV